MRMHRTQWIGVVGAILVMGVLASPLPGAGNAAQPSICDRACWGARATGASTNMATLNRAIIHHTAGSGDYNVSSLAESAAKVRAIQNMHMDGNGWSDIGYHFLVDKLGNGFEGRRDSMNKSLYPRGSHDATNTNSFGYNFMGYYHTPYNQTLTAAEKDKMYRIIAWRMPNGWSPYGAGTYNSKTVGYIDGHRDVKSTSCPGDLVYNTIIGTNHNAGEIRNSVNNYIVGGAPPPPPGGTPVTTLAGWYRMTSKVSGKLVDVAGAGMTDGTDVIQYHATGSDAQVWHFEHLGDAYYKITAKHSGKVLDVSYGSTEDGANVWQWTWNGGDAQRWRVEVLGDGACRLVAKCSGKVLDVAGASTADGADIIQYTWTDNNAQHFYIDSAPVAVTTLSGDYRLLAKHSLKALDVAGGGTADGTYAIQYRTNAGDAQVWNFQHQGNGIYALQSRVSGKYLDVSWGSPDDGALVWTWTWNGGLAQQWLVEDLGDGHFRLTAQCSGKVLDVNGGSTADGASIIQYPWYGGIAQRWNIERVGQPVTTLSGNYRLVNINSGKVLDVAGASTADGADVIQYTWTGASAQIWNLQHQGGGFYALQAQCSGKYLDTADPWYTAGANVIQWTGNGGQNQMWRVELMPEGNCRLVNQLSGLVLDVAGAGTADGADVIQYHYNGHNAQRWNIYQVP